MNERLFFLIVVILILNSCFITYVRCGSHSNAGYSFYGKSRLSFHNVESTFTEAKEECRKNDGSLVAVDTTHAKSAVVSLIISKRDAAQLFWNRSVWAEALTRNGTQNGSGILIPQLLTVNVEGGHSNNETKNFSLVSTSWHNKSLSEKHRFVCTQKIETCFTNASCEKDFGKNISRYGFNICVCNYGFQQGSDGICETEKPLPKVECFSETINGYHFPTTPVNRISSSIGTCNEGNVSSTATIQCEKSDVDSFFNLKTFDNYSCNTSVLHYEFNDYDFNITTIEAVSKAIQTLTTRNPNLNQAEARHATMVIQNISRVVNKLNKKIPNVVYADILKTVSNLGDVKVTDTYKTEVEIMNKDKINLVKASQNLLNRVEIRDDQTVSFVTENIIAQVVTVDLNNEEQNLSLPYFENNMIPAIVTANLSLEGIFDQLNSQNQRQKRDMQDQNKSNMTAKSDRLTTIKFIIYNSSFLPYPEGTAKPIVSIQIGNLTFVKLASPMSLDFITKSKLYGRSHLRPFNDNRVVAEVDFNQKQCGYFDFDSETWKTNGLCMDLTSKNNPVCMSNHLTSFALLVSIHQVPSDVALNLASQIGCAFTLGSLLIATGLYLANTKMRSRTSSRIQLHLFCNMFIAYFVFFAGIEQVSNIIACGTITVVLHYTFLTTFLWMGIYSNRIYNSLLKVFKQESDHYMLKATLFAYGIPIAAIGLNIILTSMYLDHTIPNHFCENPDTFRKPSMYFRHNMCWVNIPSLYFSFLLFVGLVLIYNVIVVAVVGKKVVFKKKKIRSTAAESSALKQIGMITSLGLSLGLSWIIGYFLLVDSNVIFQKIFGWVFAILTSFQGVVLLYLSCIKNQEMFNFWYLPLRKAFCHPKATRIFDSSQSTQQNHSSYASHKRNVSVKTETTLL